MREQAERVEKARQEYLNQHGSPPDGPLSQEERKQANLISSGSEAGNPTGDFKIEEFLIEAANNLLQAKEQLEKAKSLEKAQSMRSQDNTSIVSPVPKRESHVQPDQE